MKAFTERRPIALGVVGMAVMAVIVLGVVFFNHSLFSSGYPVSARFSSAAGIDKGTDVLLAGVKVGTVDSIRITGNAVTAAMTIDNDVTLPSHTAAAIEVETLLGVVDVTLQPISGWSHPLGSEAVLTDTSVPTELYQLQNTTGQLLEKSDTKALNRLVESLGAITKGKQQQVAEIIKGLGALTTTVSRRSGQVSQLIDSAGALSSTLASRDLQLSSVIDDLNTVAAGLADHSAQLADLIDNVDSLSTQTNRLISDDGSQLNGLLQSLHVDLGVVGSHQDDLAQAVSYLGAALEGFQSVGYSGANDTPTPWANIYVNTVTLANGYGVLGPCGALDLALDQILGPDPLPCSEQTGPLPGEPASTGGGSAASGQGTPTPGPSTGAGGLSELLEPVAGGRS